MSHASPTRRSQGKVRMLELTDSSLRQVKCAVRPPEVRDCERMAKLAGQLNYPSTSAQIRARLDAMRDSSEYVVYVAELSGKGVAGWIGLRISRSVEQDACAEITGLIIDESIRSCGIGRILLDVGERWAREQGCESVSVHSNVVRQRAHQFYERNGYAYVKTQQYLVKPL